MTVSVIMPAYNVAEVIERAITSILAQSQSVDEIIVVDDASLDSTADVVRGLADAHPAVKLISLDVNGGPAHARNVGIAEAKSDWIALLDADDTWAPERVEALLAVADVQSADFVADNIALFDAAAGKVSHLAFHAPWQTHSFDVEDFLLDRVADTKGRLSYGILKPIVRRSFLATKGVEYDELLRLGEDFKFLAEMLLNGAKAVLLSKPYYTYFQPIGALSGAASSSSQTNYRQFGHMAEAVSSLRKKYASTITPAISRAIDKKISFLRLLQDAGNAGEMKRAGRYVNCVLYVLARPSLMQFFFLGLPARADRLRWRLADRLVRPLKGRLPAGAV